MGAAGRQGEISRRRFTLLHLGDEVLVEEALSSMVERAVDSYNVTLSEHLFQVGYTSASNFLLELWLQWLYLTTVSESFD